MRRLTAPERERLQRYMQLFLRDKRFEGVQGAVVTDDVRLIVAALASLLIMNLDGPCYPALRTVLVYPGTFVPKRVTHDHAVEAEGPAEGESSHATQTVVLALARTLADAAGEHPAENVVLHEFAHQLDTEDQYADGVPLLEAPLTYRGWRTEVSAALTQLRRDLEAGQATALRPYAATNEAEFFAVATETFFTAPDQLARAYPGLYDTLRRYFRQDPERL